MIALFDFLPKFCPNCGKSLVARGLDKAFFENDFHAKCSFSCDCGLGYQFTPSAALRKTAAATGGDLAQYH